MRSTSSARILLGVVGATLALVATACTSLPDSGPVTTRDDVGVANPDEAPFFIPPGPAPGDSPEEIVRGFLVSMQANPPSTAVARSFLTAEARQSWNPGSGTIVYGGVPTVTDQDDRVQIRYAESERLDARGAWVPGGPEERIQTVTVVEQGGEWRLADPPSALAVPESYFISTFSPYSLYFYDQTGTALVAEQVYIPSGEQTATNLVRGLLRGPGRRLDPVTTTALPPLTSVDLGVVVTGSGVAQVPLDRAILGLNPEELRRAVAQLARTLRQVPGITRIRITVDGAPVPLSGGRLDVSADFGDDQEPGYEVVDTDPLAIQDRRVVRVRAEGPEIVEGPFGRRGFALRSLAFDSHEGEIAAVSESGQRLFVSPSSGSRDPGLVTSVLDDGTDLMRPEYDMFGTLWVVDRTARGAVVHAIAQGRDRVVRVPGISGRSVAAFAVTPDGTRFVATLAGPRPVVEVAGVVRNEAGRVLRSGPRHSVRVSDGAAVGRVLDGGITGPTTLALLVAPAAQAARVITVELDGSPGRPGAAPAMVVPADTVGLVAGAYADMPLLLVSSDLLLRSSSGGEWIRKDGAGFVSAAYPR